MALTTERLISARINEGELGNVDLLVRYVPIIMKANTAEWYPPRSKVSHKHRTLDCAPQLNHAQFSGASVPAAAREYVGGIIDCLPLLAKLRFSADEISQIKEFFVAVSDDLQVNLDSIP